MKIVGIVVFLSLGAVEQLMLSKTGGYSCKDETFYQLKAETFEVASGYCQASKSGGLSGDLYTYRGVCEEQGEKRVLAAAAASFLQEKLSQLVSKKPHIKFDNVIGQIRSILLSTFIHLHRKYPQESNVNQLSIALGYYDAHSQKMMGVHTGNARILNINTDGKILFESKKSLSSCDALLNPVVQKFDLNLPLLSLIGTSSLMSAIRSSVGFFYARHKDQQIDAIQLLENTIPFHTVEGSVKMIELIPIVYF
jgi:hypothetical protein